MFIARLRHDRTSWRRSLSQLPAPLSSWVSYRLTRRARPLSVAQFCSCIPRVSAFAAVRVCGAVRGQRCLNAKASLSSYDLEGRIFDEMIMSSNAIMGVSIIDLRTNIDSRSGISFQKMLYRIFRCTERKTIDLNCELFWVFIYIVLWGTTTEIFF